ncbi:hypothetical protein [Streptomyces yanii]|uniref:hypothetical protein n=1 Tax=Streptomyces yanii TaxID=78510 RepID=UPI0031E6F74F
MIVAAVVLTACSGEERVSGAEAKGKGRATVAADRAMVTRDAVWDDIRAAVAAGDFEPPRFIAADRLLRPCEVGAVVRADTKPDPEAVAKVVAGLKDRGWQQERQGSFGANDGWGLEKSKWALNFVAGTVSESAVSFGGPVTEQQGRKPFKGLVFRGRLLGGEDACSAATASP